MRNQFKYRAFISYSHADAGSARSLHRFIEAYSTPKHLVGRTGDSGKIPKRLRPLFRDRDELPSASDLGQVITGALQSSEHLIVVCSPDAARSRWVNEEVLAYKRMGGASRILCIIVSGEPNATDIPGREAEECFCEALRFNVDERGELTGLRAEPVAADARPGKDGRYLARLKLIAGMLGVGLDDLRQRDMHRRIRRMMVITSASVAGMALTLVLTWVASVARDDAERHREQADDLIGFMLGELHERLNEVGRLDILDSVSGKAMDYFAKSIPRDLDEKALKNRASALSQLGQVQLARGHLDEAMAPFNEALMAVEELNKRDPDNLDLIFDLGQAHFWIGYVHWENNDLEAADNSMRQYYRYSESLYQAEPGNDAYILELGYSFNNLAILSDRRGDIQTALDYNQRMIDLSREVHGRDKQNKTYLGALADAYSWRGSMLRADGQLRASLDQFMAYLELVTEASRSDPANTKWMEHRMLAHRFVADGFLELGDVDSARSNLDSGMLLAQELTGIEPANNLWQLERVMAARRLAQMDIRNGKTENGLQVADMARSEVKRQLAASPDESDWQLTGLELDLVYGEAMFRLGNDVEAARIAHTTARAARRLSGKYPSKVSIRTLLINSLALELRIAASETELQAENTNWLELREVAEEAEKTRFNPEALDGLVRAALYVGRPNDVDDKIRALHDAGYRNPDFVADLNEHGLEY